MSAKKPVKASKAALNRRDALRAKRAAEERRRRQQRTIAIVIGVVVLALVVGLIIWVANRDANQSITTPTPSTNQITPSAADPQGAWINVPSANGAKDGALIVDIQSDYQCPVCDKFETVYATAFEALNDSGDIALRQHTRIFLDSPGALNNDSSVRAAMAAACVLVADSTKYVAYHNEIFDNQPAKEGDGFTDDQLTSTFTAAAGLTGDALDTFATCYAEQQTLTFVQTMETQNISAIVNQSPPNTYLFGGNTPNIDDSNGSCSGTAGAQIGSCSTPDIYVNGKQIALTDIFESDWTPKADPSNPAAVLALLQQLANA